MASRREFLKGATGTLATAVVTSGCGTDPGASNSPFFQNTSGQRPNILLVLVDQLRTPPDGYAPGQGEAQGVREILRFEKTLSSDNRFRPFFQGLERLRRNAIVARKHYIASAACSPSRTTFLTGQYPSLHGVTQVDGLFKEANEVQFLDPQGVPTIGDWFRAAGFDTHYFGKWHVSHVESPFSLEPWGFASWETSGPEPHGSDPNNLGVNRDPKFADRIEDFLRSKGQNPSHKPWFAVASLVNPHDIAAYPAPFFLNGNGGVTDPTGTLLNPQPIPAQGTISKPDGSGDTVALNPDGFPQACFGLPPTFREDLSNKPTCHLESAWKVQLALRSLFPVIAQLILPYPFQTLGPLQEAWALAYGQFYVYLQYLVDLELRGILRTLDENGLTDNTMIVFTSDHGEYAMAHGQMVQKWYTAYEESVRVPFVVSSPRLNPSPDQLLEVNHPTSHIDLAPTLLGLAGFSNEQIGQLKTRITGHTQVRDFVGLNLAPLLAQNLPLPRPGVLFTTADDATNVPPVAQPAKQAQFDAFLQNVNSFIGRGAPLQPGPVAQPNYVHMFCSGAWKLNRYYDPAGVQPDQWEFYHLLSDPNETLNLVDFRSGELRAGISSGDLTTKDLNDVLRLHKLELQAQERRLLLTPV